MIVQKFLARMGVGRNTKKADTAEKKVSERGSPKKVVATFQAPSVRLRDRALRMAELVEGRAELRRVGSLIRQIVSSVGTPRVVEERRGHVCGSLAEIEALIREVAGMGGLDTDAKTLGMAASVLRGYSPDAVALGLDLFAKNAASAGPAQIERFIAQIHATGGDCLANFSKYAGIGTPFDSMINVMPSGSRWVITEETRDGSVGPLERYATDRSLPTALCGCEVTLPLRGGPLHAVLDLDHLLGFLTPDQVTRVADAFGTWHVAEVKHSLTEGLCASVDLTLRDFSVKNIQRMGNELTLERGVEPELVLTFTPYLMGEEGFYTLLGDPGHVKAFTDLRDRYISEITRRARSVPQ
jgi:hypothetical protein